MYDNINTFYKDAKYRINLLTLIAVIPFLKKKIKAKEDLEQNYSYLSNAYSTIGMRKKALRCALRAIKADKEYPGGYLSAICIYIDSDKPKRVSEYVSKLPSKKSSFVDFTVIFARIFLSEYSKDELELKEKVQAYKHFISYLKYDYDTPPYLLFKLYFNHIFAHKVEKSDVKKYILSYFKYKTFPTPEEFFVIIGTLFLYFNNLKKAPESIFSLNDSVKELVEGKLYDKADKIIEIIEKTDEKDYLNAAIMCKNLLKTDNKTIRYCCFECLSQIFYFAKKYDYALKHINKALSIKKETYNLSFKCEILLRLEDYNGVLDCIKENPENEDSTDFIYKKHKAYLGLDDYDTALELINKVLEREPLSSHYNYCKYYCLFAAEKYGRELIDCLETMENLEDKSFFDFLNIDGEKAWAYYSLGNPNKALVYINKALLKEKSALMYYRKYGILRELKKYDKALKCIDKAEEADKYLFDYDTVRSILYYCKKDYKKSLYYADKNLLSGKRNEYTFERKGYALFGLKDYEGAIKCFFEALSHNQNSLSALSGLSWCYYKKDDIKSALVYINKILPFSRAPHFLRNKALFLEAEGKTAQAEKLYKEADEKEKNKDNP